MRLRELIVTTIAFSLLNFNSRFFFKFFSFTSIKRYSSRKFYVFIYVLREIYTSYVLHCPKIVHTSESHVCVCVPVSVHTGILSFSLVSHPKLIRPFDGDSSCVGHFFQIYLWNKRYTKEESCRKFIIKNGKNYLPFFCLGNNKAFLMQRMVDLKMEIFIFYFYFPIVCLHKKAEYIAVFWRTQSYYEGCSQYLPT